MTAPTNHPVAATASETANAPAETVGVRHKLSALWTAALFVFVYVDLFSFFRPDVRAEIAAGRISGFAIGEGFLPATTTYVVIPSLMVFLSLVLPRKVARPTTITLAVAYLAALLVTMVVLARRWMTA
jgi:cbb3-type cytochrome oxidase subunit 3